MPSKNLTEVSSYVTTAAKFRAVSNKAIQIVSAELENGKRFWVKYIGDFTPQLKLNFRAGSLSVDVSAVRTRFFYRPWTE